MRLLFTLALLPALPVFSQTAGAAGNTGAPDAVVAVVDGRQITAEEAQLILRGLPEAQRQAALRSPRQFLEQYGLLRKLSALAEKGALDQQSPWKEQIEYNRMVALAQAQLSKVAADVKVIDEDVRKYYDSNKARFDQAKVKAIYIPFSSNPAAQSGTGGKKVLGEQEASAKAEKLVAEIRGGADFVKLVKEHSGDPASVEKDGDFGAIRQSDALPGPVKSAIFALKPGEVSGPIPQPNGYYIFRLEGRITEPFEAVKSQLTNEIGQMKLNDWVSATRSQIEVKIENESFFDSARTPAPAK